MALETEILEFPLRGGQNEGTQRDLLPIGEFSVLQNARYRRTGRLGKRNGYASKSAVDASGAALGNGAGRLNCLGPHFCSVDDRFYLRDTVNDRWALPPFQVSGGALYGGRIAWRTPQFLPAPAFSPSSDQSPLQLYAPALTTIGTLLQSTGSFAYTQGLLFTCWCYWHFGQVNWVAQVCGIDPNTGREVFWQEFPLDGDNTDPQQPTLLSTTNGTVVLVADGFTAGVKDRIDIYRMTSIATGFNLTPTSIACVCSAVNLYVGSATEILITYSTGTLDTRTGAWSVLTAAFSIGPTVTPTAGAAPTLLSIFGTSGGNTWVGYTAGAALTARYYDSTLTVTGSNSAWNAAYTGEVGPIVFNARDGSATEAVGLFSVTRGMGCAVFGTVGAPSETLQFNCMKPISQPFNAGGLSYAWVRHDADAQLGVATLVRLAPNADYSTSVAGTQSPPIEATLNDEDIDAPVTAGVSGPTFPTPLATPLGYVALLTPTAESIVTTGPTTYLYRKPLMVPVRHRSEGLDCAASHVTAVTGKHFVSSAQPMYVDQFGVVEGGFIQAPRQALFVTEVATGNLTALGRYQYTAYYESTDANGLVEWSAPAAPLIHTLTGANNEIHFTFAPLELTKKTVRLRVFRTKANGSQFFHLVTVDASPVVNLNGLITIHDTAADSVIEQNGLLYTQLGAELENSQYPACSASNVGGGRLWCYGGFKGNVAQASKAFLPRRAPEFVDDDAFRVFLPGNITGGAWLDNQVLFTEEGIYVVSGEGPDVAGVGAFSWQRLPFNIGCKNVRSVIAAEDGVFFESARGMMLLPRGFSEPVPQDQIIDTLRSYPYIIHSATVDSDPSSGYGERTVQWTAVASLTDPAAGGVIFAYDTIRKVWSVDTFQADRPGAFISNWDGQRVIGAASTLVGTNGASYWHPFRLQNTGFGDGGLQIPFLATTGDIRPWGSFAHGVINRVGVLAELRSACTVAVTKVTDRGTRATTRGYGGIAPDYVASASVWLEVALGSDEQRDVNFLRFSFSETSAVEGMAFINLVVEHDTKYQGFRLQQESDRIT